MDRVKRDLSPMELFILQRVTLGDSLHEAGAKLRVSTSSAGMALCRVRGILGTRNTSHAVALALKMGLIDVPVPSHLMKIDQ